MTLGAPRNYHPKWKFTVRIDSISVANFQSCSELASEYGEVQQWEGGSIIPYKTPGRLTYDDITLARGVTGSTELYDWHKAVGGSIEVGGTPAEPAFKRNLDIVQLDRTGVNVRVWRVFGCWPKRFVAGDWDNEADENVIEQLVLAYDYFQLRSAPISVARGSLG
jgi:phage tail-like protein